MDKKLLLYGRDQVKKGASPESLRFKLLSAGWPEKDVDDLVKQVYSVDSLKKKLVIGLSVLAVLVFLLVMILVGRQPEPVAKTESVNISKGCQNVVDDLEKDSCYRYLVKTGFECESLSEDVERSFCYRALDSVLLG